MKQIIAKMMKNYNSKKTNNVRGYESMSIYDDVEQIRRELENDEKLKIKIALFGQPGSGKSSLINAIIDEEIAKTGQETDVTQEAQIIEWKDLIFVDLPGYGTTKFPPNQWFDEFKPEEYDLFLCVFNGKFHEADTSFFQQLKEEGRVCLFVRNFSDGIWAKNKGQSELRNDIILDVQLQVKEEVKVFFTSCKDGEGIAELTDGIDKALDPAKADKWVRNAKIYSQKDLKKKKELCKNLVYKYSALAAANAINPIPGVDVGVDVGVIFKLFSEIRKTYGLDNNQLESFVPILPVAKKVLDYATKEGILILLKNFASRYTVKEFSKYIPIVGQVIAATTGFGITLSAGNSYLEDCYLLAEKIYLESLKADKVG